MVINAAPLPGGPVKAERKSRQFGLLIVVKRLQSPLSAHLQGTVVAFPFTLPRHGVRKLAYQREQRLHALADECRLRKHVVVIVGVDEIHPAVLANTDAGTLRLDTTAADALP